MKRALLLLLALLISGLAGNFYQTAQAAWQAKVEPELLTQAAEGPVEFLVMLNEQADLSQASRLSDKAARGAAVVAELQETARRSQAPVLLELRRNGVEHRSYWIANLVWVRGDQKTLQALAQRADIRRIYSNPSIQLSLPVDPAASEVRIEETEQSAAGVQWNIEKVRAPEVWAQGYNGQSAVVGGQDTGYQWDHPSLINQYRGWNGGPADHNYAWHDAIHESEYPPGTPNSCGYDLTAPCDDYGHGTHTMGTMVGDASSGTSIGMAPGAKWIGCRNMNEGVGKPSTYMECFEWFIAPTDLLGANPRADLAPDVINNSWSCPPSENCAWDALQQTVENVRAAGILVVVSAGNSGSACQTVNDPPAIYDASFSVGASDSSDLMAGFSSRGPAVTGLVKPDITGPGVSIYSSIPNGYGDSNGTSMAAPHVSGLAVLLISAHPELRGEVDTLEQIMRLSSVPLSTSESCGGLSSNTRPNNTFGWGRIDAWRAVNLRLLYLPITMGK